MFSKGRRWRQNHREPQISPPSPPIEHHEGSLTSDAIALPRFSTFMRHKRSFSGNLLRVLKSPSTWTLPRSPLSPKFIGYLEEEDYGYPPTHQYADESIASALEETRELKYEEEDGSSSDDDSDFSICVAKEVRLERSKGLRIINIRHRHEHSDPKFHEYGETPVHEEVGILDHRPPQVLFKGSKKRLSSNLEPK